MEDIEAREIVDGQVLVTLPGGDRHQVLVPAGVGVPGVGDEELAAALVVELLDRGSVLAPVLDVSQLLAHDPALLAAVAERLEDD